MLVLLPQSNVQAQQTCPDYSRQLAMGVEAYSEAYSDSQAKMANLEGQISILKAQNVDLDAENKKLKAQQEKPSGK
jgi:hypothetical protein